MPPLPPPNTLAQLEEARRRLEEVSTKPSKQRYRSSLRSRTFWFLITSENFPFFLSLSRPVIQREKNHQVSVQGGGTVPLFVANPNPAVLNSSGFSLQSEEYDSPSFLLSAPHFSVLRLFYVFYLVTCPANYASLMFTNMAEFI